MAMTWLLLLPLTLAVTAHASGDLVPKLGVALSCAGILFADLLRGRPLGPNRLAGWVIAALLLSAIGDAFLSNRSGRESFFLAGIAFFLAAHLGFLTYATGRGRWHWAVLVGLLLGYGSYYWLWLRPAIASPILSAAVLAYLLVSCCALAAACGLTDPLPVKAAFVAGIALIVFSDTLISFHEFLHFKRWSRWILPTYYLAHLCLAWSVLKAPGGQAPPAPDAA